MGVIKSSFIDDKWLAKCPFNYCDHFGDKKTLQRICIVCAECDALYDEKKLIEYSALDCLKELTKRRKHQGKDRVSNSQKLGDIKISRGEKLPHKFYPIYHLAEVYSEKVNLVLLLLKPNIRRVNEEVAEKCVDSLFHSEHYVVVKTIRAISSQQEELKNPAFRDISDAKTSALFAYVAAERNSRALLRLAREKNLSNIRNDLLKFSKDSLSFMDSLQAAFFEEEPVYEEIGCESYDKCFMPIGES